MRSRPQSACLTAGGHRTSWKCTGPGGSQPWRPSRRPCHVARDVDTRAFAGKPTGAGLGCPASKEPLQSDGFNAYAGDSFQTDYKTRYDGDFKDAFQQAALAERAQLCRASALDSARGLIAPGGVLAAPADDRRSGCYKKGCKDEELRSAGPFGATSAQPGVGSGTFERCIERQDFADSSGLQPESTYASHARCGAAAVKEHAIAVRRHRACSREDREQRWLRWQRRKVRTERAAIHGCDAGSDTGVATAVSVMPAGLQVRAGQVPHPNDPSKFDVVTWREKHGVVPKAEKNEFPPYSNVAAPDDPGAAPQSPAVQQGSVASRPRSAVTGFARRPCAGKTRPGTASANRGAAPEAQNEFYGFLKQKAGCCESAREARIRNTDFGWAAKQSL
eukprot:TRINITY_DN12063_c0_g1_i1.p1 TRINITY_DN12063_c0_g1~~TRINITY_DN12063_c0_g1_i1.p1  ORF type:complete len:391 (+),score=58.05 TRINITY_DN12063_c0_g1_i1:118-1290(+)